MLAISLLGAWAMAAPPTLRDACQGESTPVRSSLSLCLSLSLFLSLSLSRSLADSPSPLAAARAAGNCKAPLFRSTPQTTVGHCAALTARRTRFRSWAYIRLGMLRAPRCLSLSVAVAVVVAAHVTLPPPPAHPLAVSLSR